jgi:hypothetical protein
MKNYYFNPKTQDLHIFDPDNKEMLVLERIEGIRVLTSSEISRPTDDEGHVSRPRASAPRGEESKPRLCKKCGKEGHRSDSPIFHPTE